jgi:hypothetical protein
MSNFNPGESSKGSKSLGILQEDEINNLLETRTYQKSDIERRLARTVTCDFSAGIRMVMGTRSGEEGEPLWFPLPGILSIH